VGFFVSGMMGRFGVELKRDLNMERNKIKLKSEKALEVIEEDWEGWETNDGNTFFDLIKTENDYIFLDGLTLTIGDILDAWRMSGNFGDMDEDECGQLVQLFDDTLPLLKPHLKPFDLVFYYYSENTLNCCGAYSIRRWKYDGETMECSDSEIYDLFIPSLNREDILSYIKSVELDIDSIDEMNDEELLSQLLETRSDGDDIDVDANEFVDNNYGHVSDMIINCLEKSYSGQNPDTY